MVKLEENVKVIRVGNSLRIAIPSQFAKALSIEEGDSLHMETTDHSILVGPLKPPAAKKK